MNWHSISRTDYLDENLHCTHSVLSGTFHRRMLVNGTIPKEYEVFKTLARPNEIPGFVRYKDDPNDSDLIHVVMDLECRNSEHERKCTCITSVLMCSGCQCGAVRPNDV